MRFQPKSGIARIISKSSTQHRSRPSCNHLACSMRWQKRSTRLQEIETIDPRMLTFKFLFCRIRRKKKETISVGITDEKQLCLPLLSNLDGGEDKQTTVTEFEGSQSLCTIYTQNDESTSGTRARDTKVASHQRLASTSTLQGKTGDRKNQYCDTDDVVVAEDTEKSSRHSRLCDGTLLGCMRRHKERDADKSSRHSRLVDGTLLGCVRREGEQLSLTFADEEGITSIFIPFSQSEKKEPSQGASKSETSAVCPDRSVSLDYDVFCKISESFSSTEEGQIQRTEGIGMIDESSPEYKELKHPLLWSYYHNFQPTFDMEKFDVFILEYDSEACDAREPRDFVPRPLISWQEELFCDVSELSTDSAVLHARSGFVQPDNTFADVSRSYAFCQELSDSSSLSDEWSPDTESHRGQERPELPTGKVIRPFDSNSLGDKETVPSLLQNCMGKADKEDVTQPSENKSIIKGFGKGMNHRWLAYEIFGEPHESVLDYSESEDNVDESAYYYYAKPKNQNRLIQAGEISNVEETAAEDKIGVGADEKLGVDAKPDNEVTISPALKKLSTETILDDDSIVAPDDEIMHFEGKRDLSVNSASNSRHDSGNSIKARSQDEPTVVLQGDLTATHQSTHARTSNALHLYKPRYHVPNKHLEVKTSYCWENEHSNRSISQRTRVYLGASDDQLLLKANSSNPSDEERDDVSSDQDESDPFDVCGSPRNKISDANDCISYSRAREPDDIKPHLTKEYRRGDTLTQARERVAGLLDSSYSPTTSSKDLRYSFSAGDESPYDQKHDGFYPSTKMSHSDQRDEMDDSSRELEKQIKHPVPSHRRRDLSPLNSVLKTTSSFKSTVEEIDEMVKVKLKKRPKSPRKVRIAGMRARLEEANNGAANRGEIVQFYC